eukprot:12852809-Alexandrium_andersonii.AAC.1
MLPGPGAVLTGWAMDSADRVAPLWRCGPCFASALGTPRSNYTPAPPCPAWSGPEGHGRVSAPDTTDRGG